MFYPNEFCCFLCNLKLGQIYIKCLECPNCDICLRCFSTGFERACHENVHAYKIIDLNKIETFDKWTVSQELELFDIIEDTKNDIQLSNLLSIENNWPKIFKALSVNPSSAKRTVGEFQTHVESWLKFLFNKPGNKAQSIFCGAVERLVSNFFQLKNAPKTVAKKSDLNKLELEVGSCKDTPLRPCEHTTLFRKMNGYRPARGDFETEMVDSFEMKFIQDLSFDGDFSKINELYTDTEIEELSDNDNNDDNDDNYERIESKLKFMILDSYLGLIDERYKRKEFIRDFGLLHELQNNQTILFNEKLAYLNLQQGSNNSSNLCRLSKKELLLRLTLPIKFQRYFDSLEEYLKYKELVTHQTNLAKKIEELTEYRRMGIKSLRHVGIYKNLKSKRLNHTPSVFMSSLFTYLNRPSIDQGTTSRKSSLNSDLFKEWFKQLVVSEKSLNEKKSNFTSTYQATCKNNPLKIENYPEYEKLQDDEEKEFCRAARVQPSVFLRVKTILLLECSKAGHCSYSRARKIAGIDVNKTRLIHNLLVNNNVIKANPS